jgi:hypothetical protein
MKQRVIAVNAQPQVNANAKKGNFFSWEVASCRQRPQVTTNCPRS